MRAVCPTVSVPRLHGNAVVQAPLFETNVRPAGVGSVTTTFAALAGPLLSTSIVKFTKPPGFALDGPVLAMLTSAFVGVTGVLLIVVVALAMLLLAFVSVDAVVTFAVFVIDVPVNVMGMLYVEVMMTLCPLFIEPRLQGNGVLHAPLLLTNVTPAGGVSFTTTPDAVAGPLFETMIV